jgi:LSD1 subclass zinc finger protein
MADFIEATQAVNQELACNSCGALLKFKPGTTHLVCEYCGAKNEIEQPNVSGVIQEISLEDFLARNFDEEEQMQVATVKCDSCGATSTLGANITSDKCPFCAASLVVKTGTLATIHRPQYVLPFGIDAPQAAQNFKRWIDSLWFAPSDLKQYADLNGKLNGMYLPFWTFDCATSSSYTGQRGDDYFENETYTAVEDGKTVTRTRSVLRTRWYPAQGEVQNVFDDILIEATRSLPKATLRALEPWDLKKLVPYNDKFLSGFRTETYTVDVKNGYGEAKVRMEPVIRNTVHADIGGDRQIVHYLSTTYRNPTFKHILLPVWLSAYRYNNKVYQFMVNARTGEVQGSRPFSTIKIVLAVIAGIVLIGVLITVFGGQ